jgi:hypothetical protein
MKMLLDWQMVTGSPIYASFHQLSMYSIPLEGLQPGLCLVYGLDMNGQELIAILYGLFARIDIADG